MKVFRMIEKEISIREIRDEDYEMCHAMGWSEYNLNDSFIVNKTEDSVITENDMFIPKKKKHRKGK